MSEIGNKDLLRAIAEVLNILDVKQFASRLEVSDVKSVVSLFTPIAAPLFRYVDYADDDDVTGLNTINKVIVSCGASEVARVLALEIRVYSPSPFVAGPDLSIAMDGYLSLGELGCRVFGFQNIDVGLSTGAWEALLVKGGFQTGLQSTPRPATIAWDGLVPPGKTFSVQISTNAPDFPVNSVVEVRAIYAIGPAPFQPPI